MTIVTFTVDNNGKISAWNVVENHRKWMKPPTDEAFDKVWNDLK